MIRLTTLENRFEADLIAQALAEEGITFVVRTYEDSAYDGLYVTQKGFGVILVEEEDQARAKVIVEELRRSVETTVEKGDD